MKFSARDQSRWAFLLGRKSAGKLSRAENDELTELAMRKAVRIHNRRLALRHSRV